MALQAAFVFQMARVRSDSREIIARRLRDDIPKMLDTADEAASDLQAKYGEQDFDGERHSLH